MRKYLENSYERCLYDWFFRQYPQYRLNYKKDISGQNLGKIKGAQLKLSGNTKGWPDVFIAVPRVHHHGLFLELKTETGRVTEDQKIVHDSLRSQGYKVDVTKGLDQSIECVKSYLELKSI